jgi:hypothetical protein
MVPGAYHFLTRVIDSDKAATWNSGADQCQFFIDHLPGSPRKPDRDGLLIALDVEDINIPQLRDDGVELIGGDLVGRG